MNILITGGSSGLGRAIVNETATDSNNHVFFTYYNSSANANAILNLFPNCTAIRCDFNDTESVKSLTTLIATHNIDVLINNALTGFTKQYFHKIDANSFAASFLNNIIPTLMITQACIKVFREKNFGKIINIISSTVINKPPIGWCEYVANKSYLLSMSRSWATENIRYNITSNCVSPSFMMTDLTRNEDERVIEEMIKKHPLKRLLLVKEVANTVSYLITSSQQMNGLNILINAGDDII